MERYNTYRFHEKPIYQNEKKKENTHRLHKISIGETL